MELSSFQDSFSNNLARLNETCTDLDLGEICSTNCENNLLACLGDCNPGDAACERICIREGFDCVDGCPCHADCILGCENCPADVCSICAFPEENEDHLKCFAELENELFQCIQNCGGSSSCVTLCTVQYSQDILNCPCEEGCPDGCPCPNYQCSELTSVLIINLDPYEYPLKHEHALANFNIFTQDLKINYGPEKSRFFGESGCSILYKGATYLFGGWVMDEYGNAVDYATHVLDGCDIKKAEGVSFYFDCFYGSVGYLPRDGDPEAFIMLYDGNNHIQGYDGSAFLSEELPSTNYGHEIIGGHIPAYKGNPILIGGESLLVERYSATDGWIVDEKIPEFPDELLYAYSSVWGDFGVVIFPGETGSDRIIWRLFDDEWTNIGIVPWTSRRVFSRAVLFPNNEVMVLGGGTEEKLTKFTFNEDFTSIEGEYLDHSPFLSWWDPYAILVPDGYCLQK